LRVSTRCITSRIPSRAITGLAILAACLVTPRPASAQPSSPAASAPSGTSTQPQVIEVTGDLEPRSEVKVFAKVSGQVLRLFVREGDSVKAQDVLAEIDSLDYDVALAESKADLAASDGRLRALVAGGRPEERARAEADVRSAQVCYEEDKNHLERWTALHAKGGVSGEAVEAARRARDVDLARLVSAQKNLDLVREGARKEDKQVAAANLDRARAELHLREMQAQFVKVRAPFAGTVTKRLVDEGAFLLSGTTPGAPALCVLSDCSTLKVLVDVPERHLPYTRLGSQVELSVQAYPQQLFSGTIKRLHPSVDKDTKKSKLEIEVQNRAFRLLPGMFATVKVPLSEKPLDSLLELMPQSATPGTR